MTTPDVQEEMALRMLASTLGHKMIHLERQATRATMRLDHQHAEKLWADREAVMDRRSEVLRQLWQRQRQYPRA